MTRSGEPSHAHWGLVAGVIIGVAVTVVLFLAAGQGHLTGTWLAVAYAVCALMLLTGCYLLAAPVLGLPLPPVRSEPFWRHSPAEEARAPVSEPLTEDAGSATAQPPAVTAVETPIAPAPADTVPVDTVADEHVIVDVQPDDLMAFFEDHTDAQAQRLIEAYVGSWMRLSGRVGNVGRFDGYASQVTLLREPGEDTHAYLYFEEPWVRRLTMLRRGDRVAILGQIRGVSRLGVDLQHCELLEPA